MVWKRERSYTNKYNEEVLQFLNKYRLNIITKVRFSLNKLLYSDISDDDILNECYLQCANSLVSYNEKRLNINTYLYTYALRKVATSLLEKHNLKMMRIPFMRTGIKKQLASNKLVEGCLSLDKVIGDKERSTFIDLIEDDKTSNEVEYNLLLDKIKKIFNKNKITERERELFYLHSIKEYSFRKLGEKYNITPTRAHQIYQKIIKTIQKEYL